MSVATNFLKCNFVDDEYQIYPMCVHICQCVTTHFILQIKKCSRKSEKNHHGNSIE